MVKVVTVYMGIDAEQSPDDSAHGVSEVLRKWYA